MCGIVCYFGRSGGLDRVLGALELLAYRAPDSSGLAYVDEDDRFVIRRCVGDGARLRALLAADPPSPPARGSMQVIVGHGRWAMVGAVTENNTHPISDRSGDRIVCENGSHNATLMLGAMSEQESWWRMEGAPPDTPVHKTENTTEVLALEWERMDRMLIRGEFPAGSQDFQAQMDRWGIEDVEERALRLAVWRLREGNAHACAFYNRRRPEALYFSSHNKPIAIASRVMPDGSREIMVASDINAALMLWSKEEIEAAAFELRRLQKAARGKKIDEEEARTRAEAIVDGFTVEAIFIDRHLNQGRELFVHLSPASGLGRQDPAVAISRYDGQPISAEWRPYRLNPSMVGKDGHASYTESHIAEIPDVVDGIIESAVRDNRPDLVGLWQGERQLRPGLNLARLSEHFSPNLARLRRIVLVGEGSSWRDALAAVPLMRCLLPEVELLVLRPVALLNLGADFDHRRDLAVEISWSGTTDSLLKVDDWLSERGIWRIAITGRPQSDLARRTVHSGGVLDVRTGVEVSVATVKGFIAILMSLNLLAWALAELRDKGDAQTRQSMGQQLVTDVPRYLREMVEDRQRRRRLREVASKFSEINKVIVVGNSPVDTEAELKIEELAQIVALALPFDDEGLGALIERGAAAQIEQQRPLFVVNATSPAVQSGAHSLLKQIIDAGLPCLVHATDCDQSAVWARLPGVDLFLSPAVSEPLQPLIDAPFFFDLAVALAYARGLLPEEIDRPRNLAKSVTTTGAERRREVEARTEFPIITLDAFASNFSGPSLGDWSEGHRPVWVRALARSLALMTGLLTDSDAAEKTRSLLDPFVRAGYDKVQIIGGGLDSKGADSIARSLRQVGFVAEALYSDSAWHGPLAAVGGPDADHDCLIIILATDPLFQPAALVDTQVYRTRHAQVILVVPQGCQDLTAVRGVDPTGVLVVPAVPRQYLPLVTSALGAIVAREMSRLWAARPTMKAAN